MGLTVAVVLGTALVSALLLLAGISALGDENVPASSSMVPVLMGYSLGGRLTMTATSSYGISAGGAATLFPLGSLAATAIGVFLLARRRAAIDFSAAPMGAVALRAVVEAAVAAIVACLLTGLATFSPETRGDEMMTIRASAGWIALVVWVVVFGALLLARAGSLLTTGVPPAMRQVLRELGALVLVAGVALGVLSIVLGGIAAVVNDTGALVPVIPVLLGNLIVYALTLGTFGAMSSDASNLAALGVDAPMLFSDAFAWTVLGPWSILLFIVVVLVAVAAAARVGVRRPRLATADPNRTWQLPLVAFVVVLVLLHLLLPVRVSVNVFGSSMSASTGPSWWSSLTLAIFVAAVSVLAEVVPTWLYANANSFLRRCAGTREVDAWVTGRMQPVQASVPLAPAAPTPPSASVGPTAYAVAAGAPAPEPPTTAVPPAPATFTAPPAPAGSQPAPAPPTPAPTVSSATSAPTASYAASAPAASAASAPVPMSADAAVGAPAPPLPEPQPMSPASRRRLKLIVGVVLACLVVAGVGAVAVHVLNSRRGPEQVAESYLNLIADGRAAEATAMVDPGVPNDQRLLLTDEVLGAATSRIEVVDVAAPADSSSVGDVDDTVTVTATLSLDGKRFEVPIAVRSGDKEYGLLNTWEVRTPLIQEVTLHSGSLNAVTVGGTEVPLEGGSDYDESSATQYVYFGIYELGVDANVADYLEPDTDSLTVADSSTGSVGVEGEATETLSKLVLDAVNTQATDCVTPPGNMEEVCPYPLQSTELDSLEVTTAATEVTVTGDTFESGSITFTTRDNPTNWNKNPKARTSKYTFSGTIEWPEDGGEPTITVTDSSEDYGF